MSGKLMAVVGGVLMLVGGARAQGSAEAALVDVENHWAAGLATADLVMLDLILTDRYVDTDEGGHRGKKADVLAALKSGELKIASIKLSDMHVYVYGDCAIVTGAAVQAGTFKGQALKSRIVFTDSFIQENGGWRAAASHRTAAPGR
ncbi:MAG TPA: nuclear transport factor 2 family protein [Bryobacteraceae bacterium]|nr:nuclear transport factor 2 family protein [Bryobacteraceae bacterium]